MDVVARQSFSNIRGWPDQWSVAVAAAAAITVAPPGMTRILTCLRELFYPNFLHQTACCIGHEAASGKQFSLERGVDSASRRNA
jgi:hypothetical protein